jgi:hypothetical protein
MLARILIGIGKKGKREDGSGLGCALVDEDG